MTMWLKLIIINKSAFFLVLSSCCRLNPELVAANLEHGKVEDDMPSQTRKNLKFEPFTRASYQLLLVKETAEKKKDAGRKDR